MIPAVDVRITWHDLPAHVHAAVARILGGPVVRAASQAGGFSPGTADRVAGGRRRPAPPYPLGGSRDRRGRGRAARPGPVPHAGADVVTGFTGYFLDAARQPPPPGIPAVRAFPQARADALPARMRRRPARAAD
jgi:hypothetical protein